MKRILLNLALCAACAMVSTIAALAYVRTVTLRTDLESLKDHENRLEERVAWSADRVTHLENATFKSLPLPVLQTNSP